MSVQKYTMSQRGQAHCYQFTRSAQVRERAAAEIAQVAAQKAQAKAEADLGRAWDAARDAQAKAEEQMHGHAKVGEAYLWPGCRAQVHHHQVGCDKIQQLRCQSVVFATFGQKL